MKSHYKHLVIEGAGIGALAYLGAFEQLESKNILQHITHFAGSSSGAILAMLLAMQFKPEEISGIFATYDFSKVLSKNPIKMVWNLYWHFGLFSTDSIITRLQKIISTRHDPDITFSQLLQKTGNFLLVTVSAITEQQVFYLNPISHPDVKIIDAIHASISIPIFFIPFAHSFNATKGLNVDGGLLDNYPLWIFTEDSTINTDRDLPIPSNTLGLKITQPADRNLVPIPKTIAKYSLNLVNVVKGQLENIVIDKSYIKQTITIEIPDEITSVDFDITEKQIRELYEIGRRAIKTQLTV